MHFPFQGHVQSWSPSIPPPCSLWFFIAPCSTGTPQCLWKHQPYMKRELPSLSNAVWGQLFKMINLNFLYLHGPVQDVTPLLEMAMVEVCSAKGSSPSTKSRMLCFYSSTASVASDFSWLWSDYSVTRSNQTLVSSFQVNEEMLSDFQPWNDGNV